MKKRHRLSKSDALTALQKYCAYQERSHQDVRTRLLEHQVYGDDLEDIIVDLIRDDFLNEERYAKAFVSGKFNINKWGRNKILKALKSKNISDYCIRKGLEEIDEGEYRDQLVNILTKKSTLIKASNGYEKRKKLFSYAYQKGYEVPFINSVLNDML